MDAVTKVAKQRLSVLQLAEKLGNAAEACRKRGMDRTSFYEWKRRFQTQGFEGLKDLPPIHKSHPQTTAPEVVERIKAVPTGSGGPFPTDVPRTPVIIQSATVLK